MYQEEIADLTAAHLRLHLPAYFQYLNGFYKDNIKLQNPKSVETHNLVGGVYTAPLGEMPAYAVDIISKSFDQVTEDGLWLYNYDGHIAGVLDGGDEAHVNRQIKRHEQATEMFMKKHQHFHSTESALGQDFRIVGLGFSGAAFSGAELVDEKNERQTWIAGFRIDLLWVVSEDGPGNHDD